MCSGKTTLGRKLSRLLNYKFFDTDEEIKGKLRMEIGEIFKLRGEKFFRRYELYTLRKLLKRKRVVISTGGGLGANERAIKLMKREGLVIHLKVSFRDFLKRCRSSQDRPLLSKGKERLHKLLKLREKVYSRAHLTLNSSSLKEKSLLTLINSKTILLP